MPDTSRFFLSMEHAMRHPAGVETARLLSNNHAAANGYWRNVAVSFGREPPDGAAAREYREALEHVIAARGSGVGVITVIRDTSTPNAEARDILIQMFKDLWPDLSCAAFVLLGTGLGAAAQRSILSTFFFCTGLGKRIGTFGTIREAARWLGPHMVPSIAGTDPGVVARMVEDVVETFCERYSTAPVCRGE